MRTLTLFGALAVFAAVPAAAQEKFNTGRIDPTRRTPTTTRGGQVLGDILGTSRDSTKHRKKSDHIPPGQRPPAGMCRIWIDGVPPGQQPAPTDCQTAVANKPANARVIWGDQTAFPGKGKGKFDSQKGAKGKNKIKGHDRDDEDDDDDFDNTSRRGKSIAKRGRKG